MGAGLELMLVGMGTVFTFLTLLVFATTLMSRVISRIAPVTPLSADQSGNEDEIAAITAAIHLHRSRGNHED